MIAGIGVDVCEVDRIRRALEASHGARFRDRVFTDAEQAYCEGRRRGRFESYAARFAAKEAAMKVLGTGWGRGVGWRDVEVARERGAAAGDPPPRPGGDHRAPPRHVALARHAHAHEDERVRLGRGGARTGQRLGAAAGGSPGRRGRRRSTTTAQRPPMKPITVHVVLG